MAILDCLLLPLLIPLSWLYGFIIWLRNYLFNIGIFRFVSFDTPIISIGNITTGGTGKTPMVIYLAKLLKKSGHQPGIVSRGYGRNSSGLIMVHDGNSLLTDAESAGDEPYLMGKILNTVPIVVSENRAAGIYEILKSKPINIIILDDAFQHREVKRNLDVVMISAYDKPSDYHLLPWGNLREPLRNLKRAQYVIYTNTNDFQNPYLHKILNPYLINSPIATTIKPMLMRQDETGYYETVPENMSVFAFCGIGNPDSFIKTVNEVGLKIVGKRIFTDHHKYLPRILQNLSVEVQKCNCKAVVTTEKDFVKIPASFTKQFIFYVIKIDITFENNTDIINLINPILPTLPQSH